MKLVKALCALACAVVLASPTLPASAQDDINSKAYADTEGCTPVRPQDAAKNEAGTVRVSFLVGADGAVQKSKIVKSSGYKDLDVATHEAYGKCTFHPAVARGQAQMSWIILEYKWTVVN
ncbi:MAG TPA: energy transducer TonB [Telluria sp.]|nr:energy transducer TonB [Telluria sp.]